MNDCQRVASGSFDPDRYAFAAGVELGRSRYSWDADRALLYALGVGAGLDDNLRDLEFTTENFPGKPQQVLPTFLVQAASRGNMAWWTLLGWGNDETALHAVHGEQSVTLARPIPVAGSVDIVGKLDGVFDKGTGALVVSTLHMTLVDTGEYLGNARYSVFVQGKGGYGGPRNMPWQGGAPMPDRPADHVETLPVGINQSLIFRLMGDRNPHGTQLERARGDGFDRPVFLGLGAFGVAGRALLRVMCDNDVRRFGHLDGRFTRPAYPGEALSAHIWRTEGGAQFQLRAPDGRVTFDRGVFRYAGAA